MEKSYTVIELHKILEMLANHAVSDECKQKATTIEPSTDFELVKLEVKKTSDVFSLSSRFGTPRFSNIKNVNPSLKRAKTGSMLSLRELLDITEVLREIHLVSTWQKQCGGIETTIDYLFERLVSYKQLVERLSYSILSDQELADEASSELSSIRRKIVNAQSRIRDQLDKMVRSSTVQKYLQENLITMRDGRYVVPVKAEHKNDVQGMVHDVSSSGATLFIEPMGVVEANNEIRVLQGKEQIEIERIIRELSAECGAVADDISDGFYACIELELYFAKANLGAKMNASVPEISSDGQIVLNKARHPLIDPANVVPISLTLGVDYNSLIITGPNTGGKTVALKTIGLLTAMTMCGLLIPVSDGSKISVFSRLLIDIGDEQSIEQSLSTFSSHMTNIIRIMDIADENSLILLDELGSGTDPVEGSALAVSILRHIKEKGSRLIATTHYQEVKIYALQEQGVENACCEFDVATLKPTYKLQIGVPGKSNAFAISSKLGMPQSIIEAANKLVTEENRRFEEVVDALEKSRYEYLALNAELDLERRSAKQITDELNSQREILEKSKSVEIEKARVQATRMVEDIKYQANKLIDELDDMRREKDKENFSSNVLAAKSQLKSKLDKMSDAANPVVERNNDDYKLPRPLKKGDRVLMVDLDKKGTLLSTPDSNGNTMVQLGIMKAKVNISQLRLLKEDQVQLNGKRVTTKGVKSNKDRELKLELDLRGQTIEEGLIEVDRFIDNAILSGIGMITIIHGKGTGALRTAIQQHLRKHKSVRTYRTGIYGEGDSGVTIAELK